MLASERFQGVLKTARERAARSVAAAAAKALVFVATLILPSDGHEKRRFTTYKLPPLLIPSEMKGSDEREPIPAS
ncbi:unnamed protein product [Lampetra fluviatilis]